MAPIKVPSANRTLSSSLVRDATESRNAIPGILLLLLFPTGVFPGSGRLRPSLPRIFSAHVGANRNTDPTIARVESSTVSLTAPPRDLGVRTNVRFPEAGNSHVPSPRLSQASKNSAPSARQSTNRLTKRREKRLRFRAISKCFRSASPP